MIKPKESYSFSTGQCMEIYQADIMMIKADAIVNAANAYLEHGGGVAAAISRRGGNIIQEESRAWVREHGPVQHEKPAFTSAGELDYKNIIHAVGPKGDEPNGDEKLASTIHASLMLAENLHLTSIAFPAISTGIFGFPKDRAARVFFHTINAFFNLHTISKIEFVRIVLYDENTLNIFIKEFYTFYRRTKS